MAKLTKFFRVAVEGSTVDGRTVEARHLEEMATAYNPDTYTARINMEHLRGFSPDRPFNAYGSVVALKTGEIELELDGRKQKKLALFAQLEVTDDAEKVNAAGQKLFTSVEIQPAFADTNKAYLVGMALTDSPASLGTEALKFTAQRGNLLVTAFTDAEIVLEGAPASDAATGMFAAATNFFKQFTGGPGVPPVTPAPAQVPPAGQAPANDNDARFTAVASGLEKMVGGIEAFTGKVAADLKTFGDRMTAMEKTLDTTEVPGAPKRPAATGADGYARTDC